MRIQFAAASIAFTALLSTTSSAAGSGYNLRNSLDDCTAQAIPASAKKFDSEIGNYRHFREMKITDGDLATNGSLTYQIVWGNSEDGDTAILVKMTSSYDAVKKVAKCTVDSVSVAQ